MKCLVFTPIRAPLFLNTVYDIPLLSPIYTFCNENKQFILVKSNHILIIDIRSAKTLWFDRFWPPGISKVNGWGDSKFSINKVSTFLGSDTLLFPALGDKVAEHALNYTEFGILLGKSIGYFIIEYIFLNKRTKVNLLH